ncbi:MAG: hypothetical protein B7733_12645 [Myxococcales bacterium FL481]|nr:MAG: hypothetical protein B7733_12645 [Myxococcales bacterium FL481]
MSDLKRCSCKYCTSSHGAVASLHFGREQVETAMNNWHDAHVPPRVQAALGFPQRVTQESQRTDPNAAVETAEYIDEVGQRIAALQWGDASMKAAMRSFDTPPPVACIQAIARWLRRAHQRQLVARLDFDAAFAFLGAEHVHSYLERLLGEPPTQHDRTRSLRPIARQYARAWSALGRRE